MPGHEAALLHAARSGDRSACDRIVREHLSIVHALANCYVGMGLPYDDLVQEGSIGLLNAIDKFDDRRSANFETYARFHVRRAVRNALTDKSRLIRLPKQVVERRRLIERAEARLLAASGRAPTPADLAAATGLAPAVVLATRGIAAAPASLDQAVLPDGSVLATVVADESAVDPEVEVLEHDQAERVDAAVSDLPPRQREILTRHFGIGGSPEEMSQVAAALHLSQQRARTIERDALYALRDHSRWLSLVRRLVEQSVELPSYRLLVTLDSQPVGALSAAATARLRSTSPSGKIEAFEDAMSFDHRASKLPEWTGASRAGCAAADRSLQTAEPDHARAVALR